MKNNYNYDTMMTVYKNDDIEIMLEEEIYNKIPHVIDRVYYVYKSRLGIYNIIDFVETIKDILYFERETEHFTNIVLDELDILVENYYTR